MNGISDIILWTDIVNLPKSELVNICVNLNISSKGTVNVLATSIWEKLRNDRNDLLNRSLGNYDSVIMGGKRSISWYRFENVVSLSGLKDIIIQSNVFDPFQGVHHIETSEDGSMAEPILISAAKGTIDNEYILRYQISDGNQLYVYGNDVKYLPKVSYITVLFNENHNFLEIRAEPSKAAKIARIIARLFNQEIGATQINIMGHYGNDIERIADDLGGILIEHTAKPELMLDDFTEEKTSVVESILQAMDKFFITDDFDDLKQSLDESKLVLGEYYGNVAFTKLIINGLEKIGMGTNSEDLRKHPLFNYINPHTQAQGAYIKFDVPENGFVKAHTIQIGLTTKSIKFQTHASEESIRFLRQKLLNVV